MGKLKIPEKYEKDVEAYIKKLEFEERVEEGMKMAFNRNYYAWQQMKKDPEYQAALEELQKPFLEKYKKEFNQILNFTRRIREP